MKSFYSKLRRFVIRSRWNIGFIEESLDDILSQKPIKMHWMRHNYKDRWFADPFILDITEKHIILLVEEYYDPISRGRISRLTIDRKTYKLLKLDVTLELPSHLSFPAILRKGKKIYIYPENSKTGKLILYKYDVEKNTCEIVRVLSNEPLTDALITDVFGKEQMYSTVLPDPNGSKLSIYNMNNGEFDFSKKVVFSSNIARNAGNWFIHKNNVYRPAQDCNDRYGGALILQKVSSNKNGLLSFLDIRRIESDNRYYRLGCHTFNHYKQLTVIDANGYRKHYLGIFFTNLSKVIKKIIRK